MRALIAVEERHRAYGDAIGGAVQALRPRLEVLVADLADLEELVALLKPEIVVCVRSTPAEPAVSSPAWVELSAEPDRPTKVRVGERRWEVSNPTLSELLAIVGRAEVSVKAGTDLGKLQQ